MKVAKAILSIDEEGYHEKFQKTDVWAGEKPRGDTKGTILQPSKRPLQEMNAACEESKQSLGPGAIHLFPAARRTGLGQVAKSSYWPAHLWRPSSVQYIQYIADPRSSTTRGPAADPAVVSFCEQNGVSKSQIKESGNWKAGEEMLSNSESHVEKAFLHHGKDLLTSCLTFFYGIVVDERTPWHLLSCCEKL